MQLSTTENVKKQKKQIDTQFSCQHTHTYIQVVLTTVNVRKHSTQVSTSVNVINILYRVVVNNVYVINELHNIGG